MDKKIKVKLLIEVETSFDDELADEDTIKYLLEQDLSDNGWQINTIEIYKGVE